MAIGLEIGAANVNVGVNVVVVDVVVTDVSTVVVTGCCVAPVYGGGCCIAAAMLALFPPLAAAAADPLFSVGDVVGGEEVGMNVSIAVAAAPSTDTGGIGVNGPATMVGSEVALLIVCASTFLLTPNVKRKCQ